MKQVLTLNDEFNFQDGRKESLESLKGLVVFRDRNGKAILKKKNLVVFGGRLLTMQKIMRKSIVPADYMGGLSTLARPTTYPEIIDHNELVTGSSPITGKVPYYNDSANSFDRKIVLFGVGTGGADSETPFTALPVNSTDHGLMSPVKFKTTSSADTSGDYHGLNVDGSDYNYYLKRGNVEDSYDPDWENDIDINTVSTKITLDISSNDLRDVNINELAMFSARESGGDWIDVEMFSRITFPTEALRDNKSLTIEYHIFV